MTKCATDPLDNPLWQYAIATYALPGVADILLALQEQEGADVLWLLSALWLGDQGYLLSIEQHLYPEYERWREEFILPIRQKRKASKSYEGLYESLKQSEIEAERVGLSLIFHHLSKMKFQKDNEFKTTKEANLLLVLPKHQPQVQAILDLI